MDYVTKCAGDCCAWKEHVGFIVLSETNVATYIEVAPAVRRLDPTASIIEKVTHNLYDTDNQPVQVSGIRINLIVR